MRDLKKFSKARKLLKLCKSNSAIIIVGNIGTGKSTFIRKNYNKKFVVINNDSIQTSISGGNYDQYDYNKRDIYNEIENLLIRKAKKLNFNIIIDRTNINKEKRNKYITLLKQNGFDDIYCICFGPGNKKSLKRRLKDNRKISKERWERVHYKFKTEYENPELSEGFQTIIHV
jgi:predicted kinase